MASNPNNLPVDTANAVSSSFNSLKSPLARLASGGRIASAADDPAGLAVCDLLRADIATARQGQRNLTDGISMLQTAEGAVGAVNHNLRRMKELTIQAASPVYSATQKNIMQQEFDQLAAENARIATHTEFNGTPLFADGAQIDFALGDGGTISFTTHALAIADANLTADPLAAANAVDAAINQAGACRGSLGAAMHRLESAAEVLSARAENLLASASRISDADIAVEVAAMTNAQVRTQLATATQVHTGAIAQVIQMLIG